MSKGDRLRQLREQIGMSQVEAAEKIGVSKQTLYKYEKDIVTNIPSDVIEKMAVIYSTTPAYLMGWSEQVRQIQNQLEPLTKQLSEIGKQIRDGLSFTKPITQTSDLIEQIANLFDEYDLSELEQAIQAIKAFLDAPAERRKIALEILQPR